MRFDLSKDGKSIIATIPLGEPYPSSTGGTLIVASSGGPTPTGLNYPGAPAGQNAIKVNITAMIPNPNRPPKPPRGGGGGWQPNPTPGV